MYDSHNDCGLMPPMSRASLTIVSSAACVMVKCGEECNDSSGRTFRSRVNWTYSDVPSSLTTPDPIDLRCVSLNSTSSDDDSNSCSNNSNSNNLGRCASRNAGRASSDMCRCCTDTCYDEDAISLFYELQLENPQSKKVYRRQSSEELVAISDLFNEEPINARVVAKTIPTNKPFPLPPIPIASNYTFSGRKVLRNIRSCDVGRQGSLAIVGELLRHINDHLSGFKERKRRFSNWDSDNGSTSSFSSSFSNMNISVQKFTANQLDLKCKSEWFQDSKHIIRQETISVG